MTSSLSARWRAGLALLSAACFGWHWADLIARGEAHDLFWICNVGGPVLTLGCALGRRGLVAAPLLWLTFGTPMWLLDVLGGGEILPSSFASHFGGLAIGLVAVRRLGWPRATWWKAAAGLAAVMLASRLLTPPSANVNLVFAVWPGWEDLFPSYGVYFALLFAASTLTFALAEQLYARLLVPRAAAS